MKATKKDKFWHVRIKSPKDIKTCRVPEWGRRVGDSVYPGTLLTMCISKKTGKWFLQKIMVPADGMTAKKAIAIAKKVQYKFTSAYRKLRYRRKKMEKPVEKRKIYRKVGGGPFLGDVLTQDVGRKLTKKYLFLYTSEESVPLSVLRELIKDIEEALDKGQIKEDDLFYNHIVRMRKSLINTYNVALLQESQSFPIISDYSEADLNTLATRIIISETSPLILNTY